MRYLTWVACKFQKKEYTEGAERSAFRESAMNPLSPLYGPLYLLGLTVTFWERWCEIFIPPPSPSTEEQQN